MPACVTLSIELGGSTNKYYLHFMKQIFFFALAFCSQYSYSQKNYIAEIKTYQTNYVDTHEVVKVKDKKYFSFFGVDSNYRVDAVFEKITDTIGFTMKTSGNGKDHYFKYGKISFIIKGTSLHLFVYQSKDLRKSKDYADYLFVPFTDLTTGDKTYGSGRYLDFTIGQIINTTLLIDFNKSYNPYCAYSPEYHCPIPLKRIYYPSQLMPAK